MNTTTGVTKRPYNVKKYNLSNNLNYIFES